MYSVLNVYLLDRFVGRFSYESQGGSYSFQYDPDYLANPTEGSLSYSLPLRLEAYGDETALNFFANLLPPVYVRKKLEKCIHISAGNVFGFLKALGGDCAGAVSLYPEGVRPGSGKDEIVRELDESEAVEILKSLRRRPLYANGETGYRYSGAGAQCGDCIRRISARCCRSIPSASTRSRAGRPRHSALTRCGGCGQVSRP